MDSKTQLAPICLFTYNRLEETKQTIAALQKNNLASKSELYVFSDGWKNEKSKEKIEVVRKFLKTITGFKSVTVFESPVNKGLANSIISGVNKILNLYGKIIVLEDDLITTPNFLDFMNQSLNFYEDNPKIQSISGYSLKIKKKEVDSDVYFQKRAHSWSWGTWKEMWSEEIFDKQKINEELSKDILNSFKKKCGEDIAEMLTNSIKGVNDSWYVRWAYNHYKNNRLAVYPYFSKVKNIGFSKEGTNCNAIDVSVCDLDKDLNIKFNFININLNRNISKEFLVYFSKLYKLKFRVKLLKTSNGRLSLINEIKKKCFNGK